MAITLGQVIIFEYVTSNPLMPKIFPAFSSNSMILGHRGLSMNKLKSPKNSEMRTHASRPSTQHQMK